MKNFYFLVLGTLFSLSLRAQLNGYNYVRPITVSNTATVALTNYQLKLTVNTQALISASQMQANGNDLRFSRSCNGSTPYNYWIETGLNTATTVVWVKVDNVPASGSLTFFMFYGNNSASAISSLPSVFTGPNSATDSVVVGSAGGVTNSQRGFRFSPNEDLLVTAFGKNEPNGTTRYVTLFDYNSQAIISQIQVSGAAGTYSYSNISNPLWLTSGTQYLLELYQGSSDGYYFGNSSQIGQHLTYYDMRYCNGCTQNTFPTNALTNFHYGFPDLWYWTKQNVTPAPTYTINTLSPVAINNSSNTICSGNSVTLTASGASTYTWSTGPSTMILVTSPSSNQQYTVTATGVEGCTQTAVTSVSVNPTPTVSISGGNIAICSGNSAALSASGAISYSWNTGSNNTTISVSPLTNTTYVVTGTNSAGCSNTAVSTITVNTTPTATISGGNVSICPGTSLTFTAGGANNYTWSSSATGSLLSVIPVGTQQYSLVASSIQGCTNTAITNVTVYPVITVSILPSSTLICSGDQVSLTASGAASYTWSSNSSTNSSIFDMPLITQQYSVTGTSADGCTNTAIQTISVNPTPTVNIIGGNVTICAGNSATFTATGANSYSWSTNFSGPSLTVSPSVNTTYTVIGLSIDNCLGMAVTDVTANPLPLVTISGTTALCKGDAVNLTAGGANTYLWSTSTTGSIISVSPASSISYTVIGTSADNCSATAVHSLTVYQLPSITAVANPSLICVGETATLQASGSDQWLWNGGATTAEVVISGTNAGVSSYSLSGTNTVTGCSSNTQVALFVDACTGIRQLHHQTNTIKLYPNPNKGQFTIESSETGELFITNVLGQLLLKQQHDSGASTIDIFTFDNGVYILNFKGESGVLQMKFIKE